MLSDDEVMYYGDNLPQKNLGIRSMTLDSEVRPPVEANDVFISRVSGSDIFGSEPETIKVAARYPPTSDEEEKHRRQTEFNSDTTLNRSLSSPELLQLPLSAFSSSCTPSPLPTADVFNHNNSSTLFLLPPTATPSPMLIRNTEATTTITGIIPQSPSTQSLGATIEKKSPTGFYQQRHQKGIFSTLKKPHQMMSRPKVQINGSSILSIVGADHIIDSAQRLMSHCKPNPVVEVSHSCNGEARRRSSTDSEQSAESKRNLTILSLQNVGRTIQRTHNQLKRTRLWHAFYLLALPVYTIVGAILFQALDGSNSDLLMHMYEQRCKDNRGVRMRELEFYCSNSTASSCFAKMEDFLDHVEKCYRQWHAVNRTMTHPMSDFTNAVIYAFSVYTTIGYGTISPNSTAARIATVIYGAFGIPLFFAFVKEEGNQCRTCFVYVYTRVKKWYRAHRRIKKRILSSVSNNISNNHLENA